MKGLVFAWAVVAAGVFVAVNLVQLLQMATGITKARTAAGQLACWPALYVAGLLLLVAVIWL